eukprot:5527252-Pyramimonas_sp.AAC.1
MVGLVLMYSHCELVDRDAEGSEGGRAPMHARSSHPCLCPLLRPPDAHRLGDVRRNGAEGLLALSMQGGCDPASSMEICPFFSRKRSVGRRCRL